VRRLSKFVIRLIVTLCLVNTVLAQDNIPANDQRTHLTVTAFASGERVRFTAPSSAVQIRLEVYNSAGRKLLDNDVRGGNVFDWHLLDGQAAHVADGSYLCVVTAKSLSGRITQRLGTVMIESGAVSVRPTDPTQMTAQQTEVIGPVEENALLTILEEDQKQTTTVIAHNGEEGQITRGRGALSLRIGDFFSGKDTEQMRLTAEGNLGIGTSEPKLKLDVAGMIGAREGLMFSDGSTLSVNRKGVLTHTTASGDVAPSAAGTGTQDRLAKWTDNSGTLGDSGITETAGGFLGIGTTAPQSGLDYRNGLAPFFTRDIGTTNFGTTQSALQLGVTNAGSRNAGVGPSFLFFADNSTGAKSFLGRVSAAWENPTAGAEAGSIRFQVRANSGDTNALTERMRITASGNVGIGTPFPISPLHIAAPVPVLSLQDSDNVGAGQAGGQVGLVSFRDAVGDETGWIGFGFSANADATFMNNRAGGNTALGAGGVERLTVTSSGRVGIGTASPETKLHVVGGAETALFARSIDKYGVFALSDFGVAIVAVSDTTAINLVEGYSSSHRKFHITTSGTYVAGSDFAEALPAHGSKASYEPGDVLVVSTEASATVEKASRPYDVRLVGVYSTRPGILGADKNGASRVDADELPVAIVGIVPTKVSTENGPVRVGDLLTTSSTPGYAMRASPVRVGRVKVYRTGTILGKALEPLKEGKSVIKVLVTMR
jgi:hypothetical protein